MTSEDYKFFDSLAAKAAGVAKIDLSVVLSPKAAAEIFDQNPWGIRLKGGQWPPDWGSTYGNLIGALRGAEAIAAGIVTK